MKAEGIWRTFAETGDPICYLLYKATEGKRPPGKKKETPGRGPRP